MPNRFPQINYIGNKEKISNWIIEHIPPDVNTVFDAFSGGGSFSYAAKQEGFTVISNDIMTINFHIAKALIENNSELLDKSDVEVIFNGECSDDGFMYAKYSNVCFFPEECKQLDLYKSNIELLTNDYKKSLALILLRRAMIRKMPYSRFNIRWEKVIQLRDEEYSYMKYGRKRAYHNQTFKNHFIKHLDQYNIAVFNNNKQNKALNNDIFDAIDLVSADLIYLDPPYTGTMNDYFGFYGILDEYIEGRKLVPFENNFRDKQKAINLFDSLFSKLQKYRYWILSYNNGAYPSKDEILSLITKYSTEVTVIEKPHTYKITGKTNKKANIEYLFIVKCS